jgi:hypothetical protein
MSPLWPAQETCIVPPLLVVPPAPPFVIMPG